MLKRILTLLMGTMISLTLTSCKTTPDFVPNSGEVLTIAYSHKIWFPPKSVKFDDGSGEWMFNEAGFWVDRDWRIAPPRITK